jgi:tRNA (mo5U34)-methyltransferase
MHFIEQRYADDPTNWWVPNRACVEAMLRSSGFTITSHPEEEVYVCRRIEAPKGVRPVYPATGSLP